MGRQRRYRGVKLKYSASVVFSSLIFGSSIFRTAYNQIENSKRPKILLKAKNTTSKTRTVTTEDAMTAASAKLYPLFLYVRLRFLCECFTISCHSHGSPIGTSRSPSTPND